MLVRILRVSLIPAVLSLAACSGGDTHAASDPASASGNGADPALATLTRDLLPSDEQSTETSSYLRLRRDLRRCAAPLCGGFFVERVNRLTTVCADGTRNAECYVAELDFAALGLGAESVARVEAEPESVLLRGDIVSQSSELGEVGRLVVSEAWQGHPGTTPSGAFLRARNDGIVCITSPCLSFSVELLNSRLPPVSVADIDLSGIGSDPSDAAAQLDTDAGLLLAARPVIVSGPGGRALGVDASEYYVPLVEQAAACGSRGLPTCAEDAFCSFPPGANCGRADVPGRCAPLPEACIEIFAPVCGCDGVTYDNSCFANAAGVSVETEGPCEPAEEQPVACGSRGLPECAEGSFCAFPASADCGRADAPGSCARRPEACIQLFDPVCGCDGLTYGNACSAASAGVSVAFAGSCEDGPNE